MEIILPIYLTGLLASVLTEIVKLIPAIRGSEIWKSLTAIILVALGAFFTVGWSWANFFYVLLFAFANYKMIVQPLAAEANLPSQEKKS